MTVSWLKVLNQSASAVYANLHGAPNVRLLSHLAKIAWNGMRQRPWQAADERLQLAHNENLLKIRARGPFENDKIPPVGHISATVFGHSSTLLRYDDLRILIDPVWSRQIGLFGRIGPKRYTEMIPLAQVDDPEVVLISHDHYDHLDLQTLHILHQRCQPTILVGRKVGDVIRRAIADAKVVELDWWQSYRVGHHEFTFVPAQHFSGRSYRMNETLWGGFMMEARGRCIYYAGDSGYQPEILQSIKARFPRIDFALIPIGAYEPYEWLKHFHLSPDDAVAMQKTLEIPLAMAVHFGSFQMSIETAHDQVSDFLQAVQSNSSSPFEFAIPIFGVDYCIEVR